MYAWYMHGELIILLEMDRHRDHHRTQCVALLDDLAGSPLAVEAGAAAGVPASGASHGMVRRGGELHRQSGHGRDGEDGRSGHAHASFLSRGSGLARRTSVEQCNVIS